MNSCWLTKTIYKNALKAGRVYLTAEKETRNGITGWNLYILRKADNDKTPRMWKVCGHSHYWSNSKRYYYVVAYGTSRPLEVVLSVGHSLGLSHGEMKQNYEVI